MVWLHVEISKEKETRSRVLVPTMMYLLADPDYTTDTYKAHLLHLRL